MATTAHVKELFEVDSARAVFVKRSEDMFVEGSGLAFWKECRVYGEKLATAQFAARTVFLYVTQYAEA